MINKCFACASDYLVQCSDQIYVFARLEPNTVYTWVISDKFDKQYSSVFETDADGFWVIPVNQLPEGLLTEYSGNFKLQVFDDPYGFNCSEPITFAMANTYDCITFEVKGGTRTKNNLGCEF